MENENEKNGEKETQYQKLLKILNVLKSDGETEKQKEEYRKKYENYKKMFLNEKTEKESKVKEI